jgi:hypothetical protein
MGGQGEGDMTTYTPRTTSDATIVPPKPKTIRLAPMPFDVPPATRDETAPTMPMVKGDMTPERKEFLRRHQWYSKAQNLQKSGVAKPEDVLDVVQWVVK